MGSNVSTLHPSQSQKKLRTLSKIHSATRTKEEAVNASVSQPSPENAKKKQEKKRLAAFFEIEDDSDTLTEGSEILYDEEEHSFPATPVTPAPSQASFSSNFSSTQLPKYKKALEPFAQGVYSSLYEAQTEFGGPPIVVKEIPLLSSTIDSEALMAFVTRVRALREAQHPKLVSYYEAETDGTHLRILMEQIQAGSLTSLYRRFGALEEASIHQVLTQLLSALQYLHENNAVHGNLKSSNILVDMFGNVSITDYGLEHFECLWTAQRKDPTITAPEVYSEGVGAYSSAADMWSLGVVLYEMIMGRLPFSEYQSKVTALLTFNSPSYINALAGKMKEANVSQDLQDIVLWCLQKDPMQRPSVFQLINHPYIQQS